MGIRQLSKKWTIILGLFLSPLVQAQQEGNFNNVIVEGLLGVPSLQESEENSNLLQQVKLHLWYYGVEGNMKSDLDNSFIHAKKMLAPAMEKTKPEKKKCAIL